jgi:hypothetical protein
MISSLDRLTAWAKGLCVALAMCLPAAAEAAPQVAAFICTIGDGRRILPTASQEMQSDDEVSCHASIRDLGGRSAADLVVEIRLLPPRGPFRTVASTALEDESATRARAPDIFVAHSTWASAVDWRARRLRLVLCVLDKPPAGSTRWRIIATRRLELR